MENIIGRGGSPWSPGFYFSHYLSLRYITCKSHWSPLLMDQAFFITLCHFALWGCYAFSSSDLD